MGDVATDGNRMNTVPGAIHHAIDLDTAVRVTLRRLGHLMHEGEPVTAAHLAIVADLERHMRALGDCLLAIRDAPREGS